MNQNREDRLMVIRSSSNSSCRSSRSLRRSWRIISAALLACAITAGCTDDKEAKKPPPVRYGNLGPKKVPAFLEGTVFQLVEAAGTEPAPVSGFGFVTNLSGTGDTTVSQPVREYIIKQMARHGFGDPLGPDERISRLDPVEALKDKRNAIVRVDGYLPPGIRKGQRFDAVVSALEGNNTSSLAHGVLYRAELSPGGANPRRPGNPVEITAIVKGPVFVNPAYALASSIDAPAAGRPSLRTGAILGGATSQHDRPLVLRVREPSFAATRLTEKLIDQHYQDPNTAVALDEGLVNIFVPASFQGNWEHFLGVTTHLYFSTASEFVVVKARQLAEEAVKPDAPLADISFAWEALGPASLTHVVPLMTHPKPEIAFAAARAALFLGDPSAQTVLMDMARKKDHPFQLTAVQTLAELPSTPAVNQLLRELLASSQATVRIEAYKHLAEAGDGAIFSQVIDNKFWLDIVPVDAPPLIYASRSGLPRVAVIGNKPHLALPILYTAMNNELSISSRDDDRLTIFYRGQGSTPTPIPSNPDIAELIARLGGEGGAREVGLNFAYGDIVAILQSLADARKISAVTAGKVESASFVLQDASALDDLINTAPQIPDSLGRPTSESRPQTDATPARSITPPGQSTAGANGADLIPDLSTVATPEPLPVKK